jgi:MoaA/NifB/PqqE/SkfB family radical SAM enzyme
MRLFRQTINALLRSALDDLSDAQTETVGSAFRQMRWIADRVGIPLPRYLDEVILRNIAEIVAHAIIDTNYGAPLRLECPLIVTLAVSDYCPFACTNCYSNSGNAYNADGPKGVSGEAEIFKKIALSKIPFVMITGGEPLAIPGIDQGLEALLNAGKLVHVSTNASIIKYLNIAERYPSNLAFVIPIWGTRQRHNERRGHRSFERLEANLGMLKARDLPVHLLVIISDDDLAVFDDVYELSRNFQISTIRINRKVRVGRQDDSNIQVSSYFARGLAKQVRRLQKLVTSVLVDIPEFRGQRREPLILKLLGIPNYGSCSAGNWMMHVDNNGGAYPCFTFEGGEQFSVEARLSLKDQWVRVQEVRATGRHLRWRSTC